MLAALLCRNWAAADSESFMKTGETKGGHDFLESLRNTTLSCTFSQIFLSSSDFYFTKLDICGLLLQIIGSVHTLTLPIIRWVKIASTARISAFPSVAEIQLMVVFSCMVAQVSTVRWFHSAIFNLLLKIWFCPYCYLWKPMTGSFMWILGISLTLLFFIKNLSFSEYPASCVQFLWASYSRKAWTCS